jgi:hypothetical protein
VLHLHRAASAQPTDNPGVSPLPGGSPRIVRPAGPVPMAEAGQLQGQADVPKVTHTVPLQLSTGSGRTSLDELSEFPTIEFERQAPASGPLSSGSLREMTFPWSPMRGRHERRRPRSNRRPPPPTAQTPPTPEDRSFGPVRTIFPTNDPFACPVTGRGQQQAPARPYEAQHVPGGPNPGNQMSNDNQGAQWPTSTTSPNY